MRGDVSFVVCRILYTKVVLSLTVDALQGKHVKTHCFLEGVGQFEPKFRPLGMFFGFYKTRHILLSNGANCTVLRAVVLTQYRRVMDGQTDRRTDRIAIANTALAMRALRAL